jgi:hypothetical protein
MERGVLLPIILRHSEKSFMVRNSQPFRIKPAGVSFVPTLAALSSDRKSGSAAEEEKVKSLAALSGLVLLAVMPGVACAQDKGVIFVGGSVNDGFSVYGGALTALPGSNLGDGLAVRTSVNGGQYEYDRGGSEIRGRYVGAEVALAYQTGGDWGWASVSAGPRVTDTSFSPDDPSNNRQGTRFDLGLGTDGALNRDGFRLNWFASYGVRDESYQIQLRPGVRVAQASNSFVGLEGMLQGDSTFKSKGIGVFYARGLGNRWNGQLSGGATDQKGRSARPYLSVGLSRVF